MDIEEGVRDGSMVLIKQGAEARVLESNFVGKRCVIKERFSKKYGHPTLYAKLTLKRLNTEARCMTKARRLGVTTPILYAVDTMLHTLTFDYIDGATVKDVLLEFGSNGVAEERLDDITVQIGDAIAKLHDGGLIHGNLTTSNMLSYMMVNKHIKAGEGHEGGIFIVEAPLHASNFQVVDPVTGRPCKVGIKYLEDGTNVRVSRGIGASGSIILRPEILKIRATPRPTVAGPKDTPMGVVLEKTYDSKTRKGMPHL